MFINSETTRAALESAIINEPDLYASLDEDRLLSDGYTDEELRAAVIAWIEEGNEAA